MNGSIIGRIENGKLVPWSIEEFERSKPEAELIFFKKKEFFNKFRKLNIELTSRQIKESVNEDSLIGHAINNIDELGKAANMLTKRLREWYEIYFPELSRAITDQNVFAELVEKDKKNLVKELKLDDKLGAELAKEDIEEIRMLARQISGFYSLKEKHRKYLENVMSKYCPNILELCGTNIGGKLIEMAGSLKRLAMLPSSTVQLLGAEKALFRHLTRKAKAPKHGLILHHPIVQNAKEKGKAARALADRISLTARLDYFKGEFKAKEYREELEKRFG